MRKVIFSVFILLLLSCSSKVSNTVSEDKYLKVSEINISEKSKAVYTLAIWSGCHIYKVRLLWTDSIGKFDIGDTLILVKKR